jgi:hypothetical protein
VRIQTADVTLLIVLLLAALSQRYPQQSSSITIGACVVVIVFAITAYLPARVSRPKSPNQKSRPTSTKSAGWTSSHPDMDVLYAAVCNLEPWHSRGLVPRKLLKPTASANQGSYWIALRNRARRSDFFDLTDALPDNCTVKIGMIEIRLEHGETSVKMRGSHTPRASKRDVMIGLPEEVIAQEADASQVN